MVFIGGHPAKYKPKTYVRACVYFSTASSDIYHNGQYGGKVTGC